MFDEVDLRQCAPDLPAFIKATRARCSIARPICGRICNGANIAVGLLPLHPGAVSAGAVRDAARHSCVFVLSGLTNLIMPARCATWLTGVVVTHNTVPGARRLSQTDVQGISAWS